MIKIPAWEIATAKAWCTESPCIKCPNNPMVNKFASGFCNCTLGTQTWY